MINLSPYRSATVFPCLAGILLLSYLGACQPKKEIPGFDRSAWQQDRDGCKGTRQRMKGQLEEITSELKGLSNKEIIHILGRPDKNELYTRNQKFFIYHISPAPSCDTHYKDSLSVTLNIRFNAVGLSKEVLIYD